MGSHSGERRAVATGAAPRARGGRARAPRRRARALAAAAVACLAVALVHPETETAPPVPPEPASAEPQAVALPVTIEHVWYRTGRARGLFGPKYTGDLTVTEESLDFSSRKQDLAIPLGSIRLISYGTMRGDVDTDWVVMSIDRGPTVELVGLRDGRRMGFGQRTREIFELLLRVARQLSVAQYHVPEGFVPYTELDHQFVMAVPAGWSSHHQSIGGRRGLVLWGTVVFSPQDLLGRPDQGARNQRRRAARLIESGEVTAWLVHRREGEKGMSCAGFSDAARERLREWIAGEPLFAQGIDGLARAAFEPARLDRCSALELSATGEPASVLELRVASDDRNVFLIGLRTDRAHRESALREFERGLAAFHFSVAR